MTRRQKNLLEAFRISGVEGHTPEVPGEAAPAPKPPPKPAQRAQPVIPRRSGLNVDPRRIALLAAVVLLLTMVFLAGRWTAGDVAAEETDGQPGPARNGLLAQPVTGVSPGAVPAGDLANAGQPGTLGSETAPDVAADSETGDDRRFHDPANLYTVRVIEYRNDERGIDLAWECYTYLRGEGLPAISPVQQGRSIMLYVGASSDIEELQNLADYVSQMRGPPPLSREGEFEGAYRVNISDQIRRD